MNKHDKPSGLDESSILLEAKKIIAPQIEDRSRRNFLTRSLTLGGVAMLSGCSLSDNESVDTALTAISRLNDRVQGWLFNPNAMAPTYPESMITRPFPFNAFYGVDEAPTVEADSYRLEVTGMVADKRSWGWKSCAPWLRPTRSPDTYALRAGARLAAGAACVSRIFCNGSAPIPVPNTSASNALTITTPVSTWRPRYTHRPCWH
jgi:hypothetical protein